MEQELIKLLTKDSPPQGDELAYRKELQEMILGIVETFLAEHQEEIIRRCQERIKTIKLLSR